MCFTSYQNKLAAQQRRGKNGTEKRGNRSLEIQGEGIQKILTNAESRELSLQLSVHQEVSPRESTLTSLITEAETGSPTKRKGSKHHLQEVLFCTALAPQSLDPEGRKEGGSPAEHQSVREK